MSFSRYEQPFHEIYCAAKFAVEGYMESLASYLTPAFGIKATAVEPGGIESEFRESVMKKIMETGGLLEDEYLPVLQKYISRFDTRLEGVYQTADEVAKVVMDCVDSQDPPVRTGTSKWSEELCQLKTGLDPDGEKLQKKVISDFLGD